MKIACCTVILLAVFTWMELMNWFFMKQINMEALLKMKRLAETSGTGMVRCSHAVVTLSKRAYAVAANLAGWRRELREWYCY